MDIKILTDNPDSWIIPYVDKLRALSCDVSHIYTTEGITPGDILFILSCEKIIKPEMLKLHKHNVVIHPSDLPRGRGWSPLAWQIMEGENKIVFTAFEAEQRVDAGGVYMKKTLKLSGHELNDEIKHLQGMMTINMVMELIRCMPSPTPQTGTATYYRRRACDDSRLDPDKTIAEQFNLLRVVDNERYPAYFDYKGKRFIIKITHEKSI